MERDSQLKLYGQVADRLKEAHAKVRALQVPESVRMALTRKLLVVTARRSTISRTRQGVWTG